MSRIKIKNLPKLKLSDLLRRRKTTLAKHMKEFGINTYEMLSERCARLGVEPPTLEEFLLVAPPLVNSPTEGILILEAPPVIQESSGKKLEDEEPMPQTNLESQEEVFTGFGKKKKKKNTQVGDIDE
jgi:hypothetical protein